MSVADGPIAISTHLQAANGCHAEQILVMKSVDLKALKGVLEVLNPLQCANFMAAFLTVMLVGPADRSGSA
ncbi:hypothetical protein Sjap_001317 [Stephania japonica]|uniref:Uncharacterized protein n=1 Tax=Stephania japonica TaxID=461633 RepID=A0AAP0KJR3_9MAGN